MIPCNGFIEEVQNVRTSEKCVLLSPKLVHVLPPSVELWQLIFYKDVFNYSQDESLRWF